MPWPATSGRSPLGSPTTSWRWLVRLEIRQDLFDFIVAEIGRRESVDSRRIRPVRIALQNQRDDLLAFAGVLDDKLATIARAHQLPDFRNTEIPLLKWK